MTAFTPKQLRFMDYLEQCYHINASIPSCDKACIAVAGLTPKEYEAWINNDLILNHMDEARGINLRESRNSEALTAEQLVVANTLLDLSDRRSERNKLRDLKVSPAKYTAWKKDPAFAKYMRERAENALNESLPDIHMALIDVARRGDISGIKLAYEMTGRWSSKTVGDLNIEFLMMKIIEIIQQEISDQDTLIRIADKFAALVPSNGKQLPAAPNAAEVKIFEPQGAFGL